MGHLGLLAGQFFNGLSVASILMMTALGLALSFGLMRVINMAHGEFLMMGGYLAYLTHLAVRGPGYPLVALLVGFIGAALAGAILETLLIRHLYGRPLDTLLATWGISLVLQQLARDLFGPTGVEVTAPSWLAGAIAVTGGPLAGLSIPYVRLFVLATAVLSCAAVGVLLTRTRLGLYVRAVNQDRAVAASLGVSTRAVDLLVFAAGSGVAGLGGAALAMIAPVTPTVGGSYIVDAFLVVILGGVGSLAGTALASTLLGLLSSAVQTVTSVSFAKVILLMVVVWFLQVRPRGLVVVASRALEEA